MSIDDPREELDEILEQCNSGELPASARTWAEDVYVIVEGILETIDSMQSADVEAPTENQAKALANIYGAARNWLRRRA